MANINEEIKARINVTVAGLPQVQLITNGLKQVKTLGSTKINIDGSSLKSLTGIMHELGSASVVLEGPLGGIAGRIRGLNSLATELGGTLGAAGVGIGALIGISLAAAGGIFELAKKAAEAGDQIFQVHQKTNFAVETISALKNLVSDTGGDFNVLSTSLGLFERNVELVNQGDKELGRTFKALNIDVSSNEAALRTAFAALVQVRDGAQQTALAQKLFGRSGQEVLAVVKESNGNLDEAIAKYRQLGTLLTGPEAEAAHQFSLKLKEIEERFDAVTRKVGQEFIPIVEGALETLNSALDDNIGSIKEWTDEFINAARGAEFLGNQLSPLIGLLNKISNIGPSKDSTLGKLIGFGGPLGLFPFLDPLAHIGEMTSSPFAGLSSGAGGNGALGGDRLGLGGGGGKGGGGKRANRLTDVADSVFGVDRASAEAAFSLFKDAAERQTKFLQEQLEDRRISIKEFYAQELKIQLDTIDKELINLGSQRIAEQQKLAKKIEEIKSDKSITDEQARQLKIDIETNKTHEQLIKLDEKVVVAHRNRGQAATDLKTKEGEAFEELRKQFVGLDEAAAQFEGQQSIDAIIEKYRTLGELLRTEINDPNISKTAKAYLQEQLDIVQKLISGETERARVANLLAVAQQKNALIEADIDIILAKHSGNVIEEYRARSLIKPLLDQEISNLQAALDKATALAEVQQDPQTIEALKRQLAAIEEMKRRYKDVGTEIKDTFFNSLESGLENLILSMGDVIAGTKSIADAFREMALSIITELERIIARMIAMKIIEKALKIFAGGGSDDSSFGESFAGAAATGGWFGGAFAGGGPVRARSGGRIIQVGEGGHDEMVVTTDPRHALRSAKLLGRFIRRTGILPRFAAGGFTSDSILSGISDRLPRFAAGDFVSADNFAPAFADGGAVSVHQSISFPGVRDYRSFRQNEGAIKRDLARAAQQGIEATRGRR